MKPRTLACLLAVSACTPGALPQSDLSDVAEIFFTGVYGCVEMDLAEVANPNVRMSYPIFAERLGNPVLEGLDAVEAFSDSFCQRWSNPRVTVHEVIEQGSRVVLIWSYSAEGRMLDGTSGPGASWGGISVFRFDEAGRVLEEFGEESTPGPHTRMLEVP